MSLILRQLIGEARGRKFAPATADPHLKNQLKETQKDLNLILKRWKWDGVNPATAQEFLNKFVPWVEEHIKKSQDWGVFLSKWGSTSLNQLETTLNDTERDYKEKIAELEATNLKLAKELSEK